MNIVFISWMPHCRRSDALADELGGRSYLIHYLKFKQPVYAPIKYVLQTLDTVRLLLRDRPDLVLVASPPVIGVLVVWLYSRIFRNPFVIDAHTGVFDSRRWTWLLPLSRFLSRQAALTIVTNKYLLGKVEGWGAQGMVITDVPIQFPASSNVSLGEGFHVAVINTFSDDEAVQEIVEAAVNADRVFLHITGDLRYADSSVLQRASRNVRFTGWLSDQEYAALLRAADAVMVLTRRDHTMQRGAYEAMSLGKPLITSDWPILRETFYLGTVHVHNAAKDIEQALVYTMQERVRLQREMRQLKFERGNAFLLKREELFQTLEPVLSKSQR